jgi:hypothetical protein
MTVTRHALTSIAAFCSVSFCPVRMHPQHSVRRHAAVLLLRV